MRRWSSAVAAASCMGCLGLFAADFAADLAADPAPAGASGSAATGTPGSDLSVRVTPDRGLTGGQVVTVAGRGLTRSSGGPPQTWFVIECTTAVQGRMDPSTDTGHCDVTAAHGFRVARHGTFSTTYRVVAGIVGDGYCGTPGHLTCVLGVGTASGRGAMVRIAFRDAPASPSTTPST